MKDTEAFAVVHDSGYCCGTFERDSEGGLEPVVIVSKARYEALETCERIVHGRAIAMCEERGAEGETKEVANV